MITEALVLRTLTVPVVCGYFGGPLFVDRIPTPDEIFCYPYPPPNPNFISIPGDPSRWLAGRLREQEYIREHSQPLGREKAEKLLEDARKHLEGSTP